jgi:hypothetical protein
MARAAAKHTRRIVGRPTKIPYLRIIDGVCGRSKGRHLTEEEKWLIRQYLAANPPESLRGK